MGLKSTFPGGTVLIRAHNSTELPSLGASLMGFQLAIAVFPSTTGNDRIHFYFSRADRRGRSLRPVAAPIKREQRQSAPERIPA